MFMSVRNKVKRVTLSGGIIGSLLTNPRKTLDDAIDAENQAGWKATQIQPHVTTNLFMLVVQLAVLFMTLGLWTWGGGYLVLFEKEHG
jgi:hypothetical protein